MNTLRLYWTLARPFTLLPPMIAIFSGALIGHGASRAPFCTRNVLLAAIAVAVLNGASNGLNQIYDLTNDRINKPRRPLPSGKLTKAQVWNFVVVAYIVALALAATLNRQVFVIYAIAALGTVAYSAPPLRLKRHFVAANFTIALIRGELLKVAGWAAVSTVLISIEPWYLGFISFAYLLGAATTKDFADIEGDRIAGCVTLPVRFGAERSARAISPAFIAPWLLLPLGLLLSVLNGNPILILVLSVVMVTWGIYTAYLVNHAPRRLVTEGENHPAWYHMYWMMMVGDLGLAAAYLIR